MDLFFRFFKQSLKSFVLKRTSVTITGMREVFSSQTLKKLALKDVKICYISEKSYTRESGPPTHVRNRGWEEFIKTILGNKSGTTRSAFSPDPRKNLRFGSDAGGLKKAASEKPLIKGALKNKKGPNSRSTSSIHIAHVHMEAEREELPISSDSDEDEHKEKSIFASLLSLSFSFPLSHLDTKKWR